MLAAKHKIKFCTDKFELNLFFSQLVQIRITGDRFWPPGHMFDTIIYTQVMFLLWYKCCVLLFIALPVGAQSLWHVWLYMLAVCWPAVAVSQQDSEDPSDAAPPALCWSVCAPPPSICRSEACSSTYVTAATSRPHVTQLSYLQFFKRFPARIETCLYLLINVLTELFMFFPISNNFP